MQHFFKRRAAGLKGREGTCGFEFQLDALGAESGALLVNQCLNHIRRIHLVVGTGGGLEFTEEISDAGGLAHHMRVEVAPEGGLTQACEVKVLLAESARRDVQEGMHSAQRLVQLLVQPGGNDPQPHDAVGDEQVLQHGEFFLEQAVALLLENVELHGAVQGVAHIVHLDGLGDVAEDAAEVDRIHRDIIVGISRDHHAHEAGAKLAGALKQLHAFFPRHALV